MFFMSYEHIKDEMKRQQKNQTQMGEILGRTQGVISNIFADENDPRHRDLYLDEVPKLASWLGKSQNWILYGTEAPNLTQITARISILERTILHMQEEIRQLTPDIKNVADGRANA